MTAHRQVYALDTRALALMRIALSCIILIDLSIRACDINAFYTDEGIFPVDLIQRHYWPFGRFSLHMLSGSMQWQIFLFILAALAACMQMIGYYTRLATLLSWILLTSLQARNPVILQGGDDLLRLVLFWSLFMPMNRHFSVDARRSASDSQTQWISLFGLAYMLQIAFVYGASALQKGPEWYSQFTALYYVYHLDQICYSPAYFLAAYPLLLKGLTAFVWFIELIIPVLLFFPYYNNWFRRIGLGLIILFHLWNGFTIQVGLFFIIGIVTSIGLFPPPILNWMQLRLNFLIVPAQQLILSLQSHLPKVSFSPFDKQVSWINQQEQASKLLASILIVYLFAWNGININYLPYEMDEPLRKPGYLIRFDQNWGMFAPGVLKNDGWYIYKGITETGDTIDIHADGKTVSYEKPASVVHTFPNDRWRKFGEQNLVAGNGEVRQRLCIYEMNKWNEAHPQKQIRQIQIQFMLEMTLPDEHAIRIEPQIIAEYY